jgi:uncharacterized membrane protein YcfT
MDKELPTTQPRMVWMDMFRGLAVAFVIFHHSVSVLEWDGKPGHPIFTVIDSVFDPYRMPGLVLVAGMLVEQSAAKGFRRYAQGKVAAIVWPLAVWGVVMPLAIYQQFTLTDLRAILTPSHPTLWFLWFLAVFYALYFATRSLNPLAVAIVAFALATVLPDWYKLDRLVLLYGFFVMGVFAFRHIRQWSPWVKSAPGTIAVALLAAALSLQSVLDSNPQYDPFLAVWVIVGIAALIRVCMALEANKPIAAVLCYLGQNSLIFYVTHFPVVLIGYRLLYDAGVTRSVAIVPTLFVVSILVCWAMASAAHEFRPVGWLYKFPIRGNKSERPSRESPPDSVLDVAPPAQRPAAPRPGPNLGPS